jgi:hypothetical protein
MIIAEAKNSRGDLHPPLTRRERREEIEMHVHTHTIRALLVAHFDLGKYYCC